MRVSSDAAAQELLQLPGRQARQKGKKKPRLAVCKTLETKKPPRQLVQMETASKICVVCGKAGAKKACSDCRQVTYCDRPCQKAHWRTHKEECTQECVLIYIGSIFDGPRTPQLTRKTDFKFRETMPRSALVAEWDDQQRGSRQLEKLISKYETKKLALRADWQCASCFTRATPDICIVMKLEKDAKKPFMVKEIFALASCDNPRCVAVNAENINSVGKEIKARIAGHAVSNLATGEK